MLYVGDNHLRGSLPSILGRLTNLIHLRAAYNGITGSLPTELGSLSGLYSLFLGYNKLSGTVSSEMLRQFSQISRCQEKHLNYNMRTMLVLTLCNPPFYPLLFPSAWLSLQSNEFSGQIPSEFGLLTTLSTSTKNTEYVDTQQTRFSHKQLSSLRFSPVIPPVTSLDFLLLSIREYGFVIQ